MSRAKFFNRATPPTPPTGQTTVFVDVDKCTKQIDDAGLVTPLCNDTPTNAFETHNTPAGTNPVAESATDTLNWTSTDSTITITGDASTDTIDLASNVNSFETITPDIGDNVVADSASDTVTFTSSDGSIDITGTGASDTVDFTVGAAVTDALAVQARKTTQHVHSTSGYTTINFDGATDVETDAARMSHDTVTNPSRVTILEPGTKLYRVAYYVDSELVNDTNSDDWDFEARVIKNGVATALAGSEAIEADHYSFSANFSEDAHLTKSFLVELDENDYLELQTLVTPTAGAGTLTQGTVKDPIMNVQLLSGIKGDKGDTGTPGAGSTVSIEEEGTAIPNTPHSVLNFIGTNVTATDAGAGTANITITGNVFGNEYQSAESLTESTTSSTTFVEKLSLTTTSLPAGDYYIGWSWDCGSTVDNKATGYRVQLDDTTDLMGELDFTVNGDDSINYDSVAGHAIKTLSGVHDIDIDFRDIQDVAKIKNARLIVWRVS